MRPGCEKMLGIVRKRLQKKAARETAPNDHHLTGSSTLFGSGAQTLSMKEIASSGQNCARSRLAYYTSDVGQGPLDLAHALTHLLQIIAADVELHVVEDDSDLDGDLRQGFWPQHYGQLLEQALLVIKDNHPAHHPVFVRMIWLVQLAARDAEAVDAPADV
jgi:hypothetical protein